MTVPSVSRRTVPAVKLGWWTKGCHDCALAMPVAANSTTVANPSIRKSFIFLLKAVFSVERAGSDADLMTSPDVQAVNYISTQIGALKIYSGQLGNVNSAKAGVVS